MEHAGRFSSPQRALVTGASSGIGYEFALILARHGYDLVLVARSRQVLALTADKIREKYPVDIETIATDLSQPGSCEELFNEVARKKLAIDVLINDAGFAMQGPFVENKTAALLDMLQVNVVALTHLTRLFLPQMIQRRNGRILNMASVGSFMPGPMMAAYFATKAYVLSLSEAIANELQGTGVTVTALCPGPTRTQFAHRANLVNTRAFRGSLMEANQVAKEGFHALMKGKPVLITGFKMRLQMCPARFLPRYWLAFFARRYHETQTAPATDSVEMTGWEGVEEPDAAQMAHSRSNG
jgi:hypothetical protein